MKIKNVIITSLVLVIGVAGGWWIMHLRNPTNSSLYVINVLDKPLYDDCHIKGSINVPFVQLDNFAKKIDKNSEIILYCSNLACTASGMGARMLMNQGFTNVQAYEGGMAEWYQLGYPIEGACTQSYLTKKIAPTTSQADGQGSEDPAFAGIKVISAQELKKKLFESAA